ncbi:hypothetical protein V493_05768 [Pseudogymnoascus sp. VKM F-4281 (FW-2241)]|nr:hypothetical protein V493_05768 [Pseudogymnoascus sp. VKM F-4281 (FW-2241)]
MAHIADLMIDPASVLASNKYSSRESSPHTTYERSQTPERGLVDGKEKDKYVWRMHQPSQPPRYQLFPSSSQEKLAIAPTLGRKTPELDQILPNSMAAMGNAAEGPSATGGAGLKREPSLGRRRKPSVTDLGHMATVQEVAMDSPTIPGRFPIHERSISAPGEPSWRQNVFGESLFSGIEEPVVDIEQRRVSRIQLQRRNSASPSSKMHSRLANRLAPLIIPNNMNGSPERDTFPRRVLNRLSEQSSASDTPPEVPPKSARMLPEASPQSGLASSLPSAVPTVTPFTPFDPLSDFSASTASLVPLKLAPGISTSSPNGHGRSSPAPASKGSLATRKPSPNPRNHTRGLSESSSFAVVTRPGHRRTESEASIMDRGRPKKRPDGSSIKSATTKENEQRAFMTLPTGVKASDASSKFSPQDIEALRQQAQGQAAQFEVLASKDVGELSRELRALDERCEYLRRTHRSLRSGRRNLHDRICSYLRSPRVARFSHDAILKQEEALSELDASIDDWVSKLEYAENRRTRVRQKLLEHVAAVLMIPAQNNDADSKSIPEHEAMNILQSLATADHTPPRSPTKALSPSPLIRSSKRRASPEPEAPDRLARPVPPQLSASPPPSHTLENETFNERHRDSHSTAGRPSAESIRIYADSDVYALLADVEHEIHRMGQGCIEEEVLLSQMKYEAPPRCETPKSGTSRSGTPTGIERMKGMVKGQLRVAGLVG